MEIPLLPTPGAETTEMKKKTVITTEKREVWVVREGKPEPDQPIDVSEGIEKSSAEMPEVTEAERVERKEEQ